MTTSISKTKNSLAAVFTSRSSSLFQGAGHSIEQNCKKIRGGGSIQSHPNTSLHGSMYSNDHRIAMKSCEINSSKDTYFGDDVQATKENKPIQFDPSFEMCAVPEGADYQHSASNAKCNSEGWPEELPGKSVPSPAGKLFATIRLWREVFAGLIGMQAVYVLANFVFENPAGGITSLFCVISAAFAQLDRRPPSYILVSMLTFSLAVTILVSLCTEVRGFELYFVNGSLRRICTGQVALLLASAPIAAVLAMKTMKLHQILRQPGVLMPTAPCDHLGEQEVERKPDPSEVECGSESKVGEIPSDRQPSDGQTIPQQMHSSRMSTDRE